MTDDQVQTFMSFLDQATKEIFSTTAETCSDGISSANVVDGLFAIARSLDRIADQFEISEELWKKHKES